MRNVPDDVHRALRTRAARHGRSTEAEVREILAAAVKPSDRVQLGEPVHLAQRIKQFEVDVREGSAWRTVAKGTTVGQRRIVRFDPVEADAVRIRVLDARACPALSEVSLHASPAARTQAK